MNIEGFGAYLQRLLRDPRNDCSASCLAQAIGLKDPSSIYSWMRGDTTPGLKSRHIPLIVEHLRLSASEAQGLRQAQYRSLVSAPAKPKRKKRRSAPVAPLIERDSQPHAASHAASDALAPERLVGAARVGAGITADLLEILEGVPDVTRRNDLDASILITWQGRQPIETVDPFQQRWQVALQSALRRGWTIHYLCRLDKNVHRTARIVELMLDFIGSGAYFPRYFTSYGTMAPSYDLVIVSGMAGVVLFSAHTTERVDGGFIVRDPDAIQTLTDHVRLLATQTTPLVSAYRDSVAYSQAVAAAEGHVGGRYLLKGGLSVATQPPEWFSEETMSEAPFSGEEQALAEERRQRIADFTRYVETYEYYDICSEQTIERLATGAISPIDDLMSRHARNRRDHLRHLRNVVDLLRAYENYHLALVSERQANDPGPNGVRMESKWEVTGDNSVFWATRALDKSGVLAPTNLHITEPHVAEGFREYFRQQWERIPPINRDKQEVIALIERHINQLERAIANSPDESMERPPAPAAESEI